MDYSLQQGDTFALAGPAKILDGDGNQIDLTNWTIGASVIFHRTKTKMELNVQRVDAENIRIYFNDTRHWIPGYAHVDVQFVSPTGVRLSARSARFPITEDGHIG